MTKNPTLDKVIAALAVLLGIALIVVGIVYLANTESGIPSWFPGHSSTPSTHHHAKHGIAAILLGLAAFALAWFALGPKRKRVSE